MSLGSLTFAVPDADAAVAYIRSTVGAPWGQTTNEQAMDLAFGPGGWDDLRYETVAPGTLLSPTYTFIYMEGSDSNASELAAFLGANGPAINAWVTAGGSLFLNAAPNEGMNINAGFGATIVHPDFSTNPGMAVDPTHPIWVGPHLPTSPAMFTGSSYAHASVTGPPASIPLIIDADGGNPQLLELPPVGAGRVIVGGLTTSNYWTPAPEALNLRANIIEYLFDSDSDLDGVSNGTDNCPADPNPLQEDADMDMVGDVCDACPMDATNDPDMDMACDDIDNCIDLANPLQEDADMDGVGDDCDACPDDAANDADGDAVCGDVDNCPDDANDDQADDDMDGVGNACDACPNDPNDDADGDGVCGDVDNCPDNANSNQTDTDGDGIGDACDDPPAGDSSGGGDGGSSGNADGGNLDAGSTSGAGDGSGTTGSPEDEYEYNPGCNCTTTPRERTGGWWMLLGAGLLGLRRRRRT